MSIARQNSSNGTSEKQSDSSALFSNLVLAAGQEGVEDEKCVVAQYRTSVEQRKAFSKHLSTCTRDRIAIEWVIDIADETNGWFYGTAYHYDDITQMLHVMMPDKLNPSFDGSVLLDYRTVHLIECVDGKTDALFNKIVRESVVKVRWEVDWFEEDASTDGKYTAEQGGRWLQSCARYYLRIANQVLVEDDDFGNTSNASKGFVMLTADTNLRLKVCLKGKGQDDFDRLVTDGSVLSTAEVMEEEKQSILNAANNTQEEKKGREGREGRGSIGGSQDQEEGMSVRRIADMSRGLKECVSDLLDEREKTSNNRSKMSKMFQQFAMSGDLDAGLNLLADAEEVAVRDEKKRSNERAVNNGDKEEKDDSEALADEAWLLVQRLEKSAIKLLRAGGDAGSNAADELEFLRRYQRKMKKELEEKDREIRSLYASRSSNNGNNSNLRLV